MRFRSPPIGNLTSRPLHGMHVGTSAARCPPPPPWRYPVTALGKHSGTAFNVTSTGTESTCMHSSAASLSGWLTLLALNPSACLPAHAQRRRPRHSTTPPHQAARLPAGLLIERHSSPSTTGAPRPSPSQSFLTLSTASRLPIYPRGPPLVPVDHRRRRSLSACLPCDRSALQHSPCPRTPTRPRRIRPLAVNSLARFPSSVPSAHPGRASSRALAASTGPPAAAAAFAIACSSMRHPLLG